MSAAHATDAKRAIRLAMAQRAYESDVVRLADGDVAGWDWLVTSHNGLFAVADGKWKLLIHGWFYGICRDGDGLYLFENCGRHDRSVAQGRLLRLRIEPGQLLEPQILAKGLDGNCHQIRVIDDLICVVDTAGQQVLRFTLAGGFVDAKRPFPVASDDDRSGAYVHLNALARVRGRLALLLHNGKALPERHSELAWLDDDWQVTARVSLGGYKCHDIVEDDAGVIWHSDSMRGEIMASDGRRAQISDEYMTRGIAFGRESIAVGLSIFSQRQQREGLRGALAILNRQLEVRELLDLPGSPTDVFSLQD